MATSQDAWQWHAAWEAAPWWAGRVRIHATGWAGIPAYKKSCFPCYTLCLAEHWWPESKRNCKGKHSRETSTEQQLSEASEGVEMTLENDYTGRAASLGDGPSDRAVSLGCDDSESDRTVSRTDSHTHNSEDSVN